MEMLLTLLIYLKPSTHVICKVINCETHVVYLRVTLHKYPTYLLTIFVVYFDLIPCVLECLLIVMLQESANYSHILFLSCDISLHIFFLGTYVTTIIHLYAISLLIMSSSLSPCFTILF